MENLLVSWVNELELSFFYSWVTGYSSSCQSLARYLANHITLSLSFFQSLSTSFLSHFVSARIGSIRLWYKNINNLRSFPRPSGTRSFSWTGNGVFGPAAKETSSEITFWTRNVNMEHEHVHLDVLLFWVTHRNLHWNNSFITETIPNSLHIPNHYAQEIHWKDSCDRNHSSYSSYSESLVGKCRALLW